MNYSEDLFYSCERYRQVLRFRKNSEKLTPKEYGIMMQRKKKKKKAV